MKESIATEKAFLKWYDSYGIATGVGHDNCRKMFYAALIYYNEFVGQPNCRKAGTPELLEACKQAADWLARSTRIDDQEQGQDLRAAIAKAEGQI